MPCIDLNSGRLTEGPCLQVCNHPELFERADVTAPFSCSNFNQSYGLNREGNALQVQYSANSYLDVQIPRLLFDEQPAEKLAETSHIAQLMNVWSVGHIARSTMEKSA